MAVVFYGAMASGFFLLAIVVFGFLVVGFLGKD